jgi:azurin
MKHLSPFFPAAIIAAVVFTSGCGQSEKPAVASSAAPAADAAGGRTLNLTADDTMKYSLTTLEARPGEALRVTLTNVGRMPKQTMAHNWVLLKPGTDDEVNAFGMAAATAAPDYIPAAKAAQIIAQTKLVGPGESASVEFKAPEQPGVYPFLCTFPGHFAMMKGKLIVK